MIRADRHCCYPITRYVTFKCFLTGFSNIDLYLITKVITYKRKWSNQH